MTKLNNNPIIRAVNVSKTASVGQKSIAILDGINLSVMDGDSLAIVGNSGSGKTTLLTLLAGLDVPSTGEIYLGNSCISKLDEHGRAMARMGTVGFVFQSFHLIPELTALENIALPLEINGFGRSVAHEKANYWINVVGLSNRADHYPNTLSGGEQQRIALARAFVTSPKLLFADEPTGSLDQENASLTADLLFKLNRESGCTLILVTHDIQLANKCDYQITLKGGKVLYDQAL